MGKPYSKELDHLSSTFQWAENQDVGVLRHFLKRWNGEYALIVGSGGSYSATDTISLFRELAFHSATAASSPLDCISKLNRLTPHVFLLSAEGKNRDILAAAECAAAHDLFSGALTLTSSNPLSEFAERSGALCAFNFPMDWEKDGYLATNTLAAMILVFYRVFFGDDAFTTKLARLFDKDRLKIRRAHFHTYGDEWLSQPGGLLVVYSMDAQSFAVDLESKLAEAAIATVQIADLRQFAHGRHLQLGADKIRPVVIVAYSSREAELAAATLRLFPPNVKTIEIAIDGESAEDVAVAGILDAMLVTEAIAASRDYDPGQPVVPDFGRQIYALDVRRFGSPLSIPCNLFELAARRKMGVPANEAVDASVYRAAVAYHERLTSAVFKAIVCDYDGTLCRAERRYERPSNEVANEIVRLVSQGMVFAIATGRGDSLRGDLQAVIPKELHGSIYLGYYSGAYIGELADPFNRPAPNPEFQTLWEWLGNSAYKAVCNKSLEDVARGGQLSLRVASARHSSHLRAAIRAWLDYHGCRTWRVFSSGHSVDVLDEKTSKRHVVSVIASRFNIDKHTQLLRLGDCGHEEGNDFELLSEGLSLSCHSVSADVSACWNFGLTGCNQTATTLRYLRSLHPVQGGFQFNGELTALGGTAV